jgi:HD-GYP domain-containing protein (c-di-GMP phosphodiesterase class II)
MSATNKRKKKNNKPESSNRQDTAKQAESAPVSLRRVPLSEVIASLSHALDMTEGQPQGHSVRSCMIGMRLGEEAGFDRNQLIELYYALLLKDAGCSSNASRIASLFGSDDQYVKPRLKTVDSDDRRRLAMETWRTTSRGGSVWSRMRHFLGIAHHPGVTRELIAARCERGAGIVRNLGFPEGTATAIQSLDEHWNGKGHPQGLEGEAIPRLSRVMNLAQTIEVFLWKGERDLAVEVLRDRSGRWFEPALVDIARDLLFDDEWCALVRSPECDERVAQLEPGAQPQEVDEDGLDQIAQAFADIIDAKSSFTARHSSMVAEYARLIGQQMGFASDEIRRLYRAGLLHDIGKLGVSSRILDKPGRLNRRELAEVKEHPRHTWEILRRVRAFEDFAMLASLHHEKLDGSGYPWGRTDEELDMPARVLVVADIYQAVTESRAYRVGLTSADAMEILRSQAAFRVDSDAIEALAAAVGEEAPIMETPEAL